MSNLIDKAKSAILHHGTTGFEEIAPIEIYASEGDDTPIVSGFAVHIDELPEPVIFQGSGYAAAEDMARAYVAMRRAIPEMIERLEEQEEEIERLRGALKSAIARLDALTETIDADVGAQSIRDAVVGLAYDIKSRLEATDE